MDTPGPLSRNPSVSANLSPSKSHIRLIREDAEKVRGLLEEKDAVILTLEKEIRRLNDELQTRNKTVKRSHPLEPILHQVDEKGTNSFLMGRHASMATNIALRNLGPQKKRDDLASKMIRMFKEPKEHADYITSSIFAVDLLALCKRVKPIFENEPRVVFLQSPTYVFGDIHGNLEDLHFFADNIWKLGMKLTAGNFLFLGDYVDRGLLGLETVAYLFAMKLECPYKMFMLRGNHELRDVNGWVEYYQEKSFLWQCQNRFGMKLGEEVWEECNSVFDRMPLAGIIDNDIFCVHGGIPRPIENSGSRIQDILSVPAVASVCPASLEETIESNQVASDCLWSDPAKHDQEEYLDEDGFGESMRGGGAICFGSKAIENLLKECNLSYIVRAHEAHSEGVSISKGAKVFTVFSTSKDHGQGKRAMCGCILVDFDKIQVITRSNKYKDKYIHRRDSMSLVGITAAEQQKLFDIGVIKEAEVKYHDEFLEYIDGQVSEHDE